METLSESSPSSEVPVPSNSVSLSYYDNNNNEQEDGEEGKAKKRIADKQSRRGDETKEDEDAGEQDEGTWRKAEEEVISQRRKVKVRRGGSGTVETPQQSKQEEAAPPLKFNLTPIPESSSTTKPNGTKSETEQTATPSDGTKKETTTEQSPKKEENATQNKENSKPFFNFFANTTPTPSIFNFSTTPSNSLFSFNTSPAKAPSPFSFAPPSTSSSPGSIFGVNISPPATVTSSEDTYEEQEVPIFSTPPVPVFNLKPAEPVSTGEEDEQHVFQSRAKLFIFDKSTNGWRERGVGGLKLNRATDGSEARLLMRVEGSLRLILNVRLWPSMHIERTGDKDIRFIAQSLEKEGELCTYGVRVGRKDTADDLVAAIEKHKQTDSSSSSKPEKKSTTVI